MKERAAFALAFGRLALAHSRELDDPTLEVYWESLNDVPIQPLVAALNRLTRNAAGFFPKPGEIRKAVDDIYEANPLRLLPALPSSAAGFACDLCEDTCWSNPDPKVWPAFRCGCYPHNYVYNAAHPRRTRFFQP